MDSISRENLSALMDGELAAEPTRFLLRRLEHDPELGATWSRWHLIRACLAADASQAPNTGIDSGFTARVAAALAAEAAPPTHRRRWARYVGGSAIAASVAVAALMLNVPHERAGQPEPVAQTRPASTTTGTTAVATLAKVDPAVTNTAPPWLLARQPTVLSAQPASANVVYGTGLMQPDYLRNAAYTRDAAMAYAAAFPPAQARLPFSIMLVPAAPPPRAASGQH